MGGPFPILKRFALWLVIPFAVLVAGCLHHLRGGLPPAESKILRSGGVSVHILRDAHGVPTISATKDEDVYFGMGYVHAQDRLWQLEWQRRLALGKLSEVLGKDALSQDIWLRTLGIQDAARSAWAALGEPARRSLTAYTEGINAWLNEKQALPIEFTLLGIRPQPWTEVDSLAWSKMFALTLAGDLSREIAKSSAVQMLSREQASFLFPGSTIAFSVTDVATGWPLEHSDSFGVLQRHLEDDLNIGGRYVGSNAWVVSGKFTHDGGALLANDPHLGLQMPSMWYPVTQRGGALYAQGMTLVGLPLVVFGRNQHIAWGGTNLMADVQDLFVERFDSAHPGKYLADGRWEAIDSRVEEIPVAADFPAFLRKPLKPVRVEVRRTRNGPIISDALGRLEQPVALRWVALDGGDRSYEALMRLSYAQNWTEFREALRDYTAPALNMLYADQQGNIGYMAVGRIPQRKRGDGSLPMSGWEIDNGWKGYIPFDELPTVYNPDTGYIVSANDKIVDASYPYLISNDWAPAGRAQRIEMLLREKLAQSGQLSLEDFKIMQADVVSLPARDVLSLLTDMKPEDERQREALELLRGWNGSMSKDSSAAGLFNVWMDHLRQQLFVPATSGSWSKGVEQGYLVTLVTMTSLEQIQMALMGQGGWCVAGQSEEPRSCQRLLSESLSAALDALSKLTGSDPDEWRWGDLHQKEYGHMPFSHVKGLSSLFERKIVSGGSPDTIDVSGYQFRPSKGYFSGHGAGFRHLIKLRGEDNSYWYMNSTGQSANILSRHYADMLAPFERAEYYVLDSGE